MNPVLLAGGISTLIFAAMILTVLVARVFQRGAVSLWWLAFASAVVFFGIWMSAAAVAR